MMTKSDFLIPYVIAPLALTAASYLLVTVEISFLPEVAAGILAAVALKAWTMPPRKFEATDLGHGFFYTALTQLETVIVTMKDGRVFVGWVIALDTRSKDTWFKILPLAKGFQSIKQPFEVRLGTYYHEFLSEAADDEKARSGLKFIEVLLKKNDVQQIQYFSSDMQIDGLNASGKDDRQQSQKVVGFDIHRLAKKSRSGDSWELAS